jgi:hypothetical protein
VHDLSGAVVDTKSGPVHLVDEEAVRLLVSRNTLGDEYLIATLRTVILFVQHGKETSLSFGDIQHISVVIVRDIIKRDAFLFILLLHRMETILGELGLQLLSKVVDTELFEPVANERLG